MRSAAKSKSGTMFALRLTDDLRTQIAAVAKALEGKLPEEDIGDSAVIRAMVRYATNRRKEFLRWAEADPDFYLRGE